MPEFNVTSEIYSEHDYKTLDAPTIEGNVISKFPFLLPSTPGVAKFDEDNDLDIERPKKEAIKIEHSPHTSLSLVGRQVWRGALLLADLMLQQGLRGALAGAAVLELGAGTGLAGLVAAMFAERVVCTDIDLGGILGLIRLNAKHNARLLKGDVEVRPLDFTDTAWSPALAEHVAATDVVLAADVIYDDDVTAAFVSTMQKVLNTNPPKTLYLALEKRFVFTIEHLESVAPCYETFLTLLDKLKSENMHSTWHAQQIDIDIPKYFTYDRVKELVLWKISSVPLK